MPPCYSDNRGINDQGRTREPTFAFSKTSTRFQPKTVYQSAKRDHDDTVPLTRPRPHRNPSWKGRLIYQLTKPRNMERHVLSGRLLQLPASAIYGAAHLLSWRGQRFEFATPRV